MPRRLLRIKIRFVKDWHFSFRMYVKHAFNKADPLANEMYDQVQCQMSIANKAEN